MFPMPGQRNHQMPPYHYGPNFGRPPSHPFMGMSPNRMQRKGGGLLSKLLGNKSNVNHGQLQNAYRAFGSAPAQGGGSILKSLTNPTSLNSFLTNTQKVLSTAQQVGPIVQQYGPIVKNLPTMWKLYRGLKNAPEFSGSNESEDVKELDAEELNNKEATENVNLEQETQRTKRNSPSPSIPKLYI